MNMQTMGWPTELTSYGAARLRLVHLASLTPDDFKAWDRLSEQAAPGAFFAHRWFLEPLLDVPGRILAVAEDAQGQWLGIMALDRVERLGRLPAPLWHGVKDANQFLGTPLIRTGQAICFWQTLISGLESSSASCIGLYLPASPEGSEAVQALKQFGQNTNRRVELIRTTQRAALSANSDSAAQFERIIPSKRRARLVSLSRQAEAELGPFRLEQVEGRVAVADWIDQFLALELAGWKGKAGSAMACSPKTERLFRSVVTGALEQGYALCLTLFAGDVALARSVQFIDGTVGCGFKTCYDERYARYAPGLQLLLHITKLICERPGLRFDSCSTPDQASINGLWPDRITIDDYCLGFKGKGRAQMFDAVMALRKLWHQGKSLIQAER
jgi:CelD/BcsL family acetyltransferase involved in cellulose biosynthesis